MSLGAAQGGVAGASIQITSPPGAGDVTLAGGTSIQATFSDATGFYVGSGCTIAYMYRGHPVPGPADAVAPGRIWGHLECPALVATLQGADGGRASAECEAEADFLFENCAL